MIKTTQIKSLAATNWRFHKAIFVLTLCLTLIVPTPANDSHGTIQQSSKSAVLLKSIGDEYYQKIKAQQEGIPDLSYTKAQTDAAFAQTMLDKLKAIKPTELTHEETISLEILRWKATQTMESLPFFWYQPILTPYASPLRNTSLKFVALQFNSKDDLSRYLTMLRSFAAFVKTMQANTAEQRKQHIILPKDEIKLVLPYLSSFLREPEQSAFYVSEARLVKIAAEERAPFQQKVVDLIKTEINANLQSLITYVGGEYLQQAPEAIGQWQYPQGKEFYRHLVRFHTTLNITPEEVHRTGLAYVQKINEKMARVRQQLGYKGTKAEFHQYLKSDAKFFPKTADEIGERLMHHAKRIAPKLSDYFSKQPQAPYGVKRLETAMEGAQTFGYYQRPTKLDPKGYYNYNGSNLSQRSTLNAASLVFHELCPGHHFQINLQAENKALPAFRRESTYTAYSEGWGEYASQLGEEMQMYEDPYDMYGRLAMEMFVSVRLVVDSGMNYFGWSRSKAIEFMRDNALESEAQLQTETLRYACDLPGQALAYKMGASQFLTLREKAQKELDGKFNIRDFHDAVLASGSMPMEVLSGHVDWFIANHRK